MSYYIEISIFGKVSDPAAVHQLAEAVRDEDGLDESVDAEEVVERLIAAAATNSAMEFSGNGYDDVFSAVTDACQEAGLSYVWTIGEPTGESPTNGKAWKPGMAKEIEFLTHERKTGVPLGALTAAAKRGSEAVANLIETYASATRVGKVEVEPGFAEAYQSWLAGQDEEDENEEGMRP